MVIRDFPHEAAHFSVLGLFPLIYVHSQLLVGLREIIKSLVCQHTGLERGREEREGGERGGREREEGERGGRKRGEREEGEREEKGERGGREKSVIYMYEFSFI